MLRHSIDHTAAPAAAYYVPARGLWFCGECHDAVSRHGDRFGCDQEREGIFICLCMRGRAELEQAVRDATVTATPPPAP